MFGHRIGGQGVVTYGTLGAAHKEVAIKFFIDRVAFERECAAAAITVRSSQPHVSHFCIPGLSGC